MRFMMMVKANSDTEAGVMPSEKLIAAMTRYNEELSKPAFCLISPGCNRARRAPASSSPPAESALSLTGPSRRPPAWSPAIG